MNTQSAAWQVRLLEPREMMPAEALGMLWRVRQGMLRIDSQSGAGDMHFVRLALAGDLLGMEALAGVDETLQVQALTPVEIEPVCYADERALLPLLVEAVAIAHQRCREVVSLRSGAVELRVRRLLDMVARAAGKTAGATQACVLPGLSNMAEIVHSTPESVCRVLTQLRKQQVLEKVSGGNVRSKGLEHYAYRMNPADFALAG